MSDYIPTRYEEFQFLMKRILLDSLTLEEVGIFHFCLQSELQLPERLLCSPNVPMAILRHLKNNNTIKNWCKEPQSLKKVLIELHRKDLADRVDYFKENGKKLSEHTPTDHAVNISISSFLQQFLSCLSDPCYYIVLLCSIRPVP